jgi:hypothetical protein
MVLGDAGDLLHCRNAAVTGCRGFPLQQTAAVRFVEMLQQSFKTFASNIEHARRVEYDPKFGNASKSHPIWLFPDGPLDVMFAG